jgi:hypothetical protein
VRRYVFFLLEVFFIFHFLVFFPSSSKNLDSKGKTHLLFLSLSFPSPSLPASRNTVRSALLRPRGLPGGGRGRRGASPLVLCCCCCCCCHQHHQQQRLDLLRVALVVAGGRASQNRRVQHRARLRPRQRAVFVPRAGAALPRRDRPAEDPLARRRGPPPDVHRQQLQRQGRPPESGRGRVESGGDAAQRVGRRSKPRPPRAARAIVSGSRRRRHVPRPPPLLAADVRHGRDRGVRRRRGEPRRRSWRGEPGGPPPAPAGGATRRCTL